MMTPKQREAYEGNSGAGARWLKQHAQNMAKKSARKSPRKKTRRRPFAPDRAVERATYAAASELDARFRRLID